METQGWGRGDYSGIVLYYFMLFIFKIWCRCSGADLLAENSGITAEAFHSNSAACEHNLYNCKALGP